MRKGLVGLGHLMDFVAFADGVPLPLERIQRSIPDDAALVLWITELGERWGCVVRSDGSPRWQPNQPRMYMTYPSGDAVVELIPESAKLNINRASPDDLLRVVATVTKPDPSARG